MLRLNFTLLFVFVLTVTGFSQKEKISKADKAALDSMARKDEFLNMENDKKGSILEVGIGIGNGTFSMHNRSINATGTTNDLIFTPSVIYHHKSGLSIGVTSYIASDSAKSGLYQTGIIGSYDYDGKEFNAGISYTYFITDINKFNNKSIYQNDVSAYIKSARGALRPLLELGYASGKYKEINYVPFTPGPPLPPITRYVHDSTENKTSYFAVTIGVEHVFSLYNIFNKEDGLEITPSIVLNSGNDKLTTTHLNAAYAKLSYASRRKRNLLTSNVNQKFKIQSVGAAIDMNYTIGKFFVRPNLYVDYYLPSTTATRLTAIWQLMLGVSF